ncbi:MAG: tetratricopeptide repeat protein [Candidatus Helarchaeota archaeon]
MKIAEKVIEAYAIAVTAFQKGDLSKAIKYWKKVVKARGIEEKVKGKAYLGLGFCYSRKDNFKEALNAYKSALTIFRSLNNKKAQAECLGIIGGLYFRNNYIKEALTTYEMALYFAKQIKNREMEADILGDIGSVLDYLDRFNDAIDVFTRSLKIYRKIGRQKSTRGEARALYDLGMVYYHAKRLGEARAHLDKALRLMKKNNDRKGEANCYATLGDVHLELGEIDIAEKNYGRALKFFTTHNSLFGIINTKIGLAKIALQKNDLTSARKKFEETFTLASKGQYPKLMASSLLYLSKVYEELGDQKEAKNYKTKAQKILKELGIKIEEMNQK